jgi:hypothetical protein
MESAELALERVAVETGIAVAPNRQHTAWNQHSGGFLIEPLRVEPMESLGNGDQINARRWETTGLGRHRSVIDARVAGCLIQHRDADVCGHHSLEAARQRDRCLPAPSSTVPGHPRAVHQACQIAEEPLRIRRPVCGVGYCRPGEMIGQRLQAQRTARCERMIRRTSATGIASTVPRRELTVVAANSEL